MNSKDKIKKIYPLAPSQEGMYYLWLSDKESWQSFVQIEAVLRGELDVSRLEQSMDALVKRYDILRTVFVHDNLPRPLQVVMKERKFCLHFEDVSELAKERQEAHLRQWKQDNKARGFDLSKDLLVRMAVFRTGPQEYRWIWCNHHIILDGWSFARVFRELLDNYRLLQDKREPVTVETSPYSHYQEWLEKQDKKAGIAYWQKTLAGLERSRGGFPVIAQAHSSASDPSGKPAVKPVVMNVNAELGQARMDRLQQLARACQATINSVFQAAWAIVLRQYMQSDDVVFGSIVSGRPAEVKGIEEMVGLFLNTIPVRIRLQPGQPFAECLKEVQRQALESKAYDFVPLQEMNQATDVKHRQLDHLMIFENFPFDRRYVDNVESKDGLGFEFADIRAEEETEQFNIYVYPQDAAMKFNFNASLYEPWLMEQLKDQFIGVLDQIMTDETVPVDRIEVLTPEDKRKLLGDFFQSIRYEQADQTLHACFADQVRKTPEHPALICGMRMLTYRELHVRSNQLAHVLRRRGVQPDDRIGLRAERSVEMIAGMLGILKAGAAFVPIPPDYPADRQAYMIADSGMKLLLTTSPLGEIPFAGECIDLRDPELDRADREELLSLSGSRHLAYVIYTSGTTGKPKGVLIEHGGAVNTVLARRAEYPFDGTARVLQLYSYAFDAFLSCLFTPLLSGSTVVLATDEEARNPLALRDHIRDRQVTHLDCVPSVYTAMIECLGEEDARSLRVVTLGGERLPAKLVKRSRERFPHIELADEYGPTENSIVTTLERNVVPDRPLSIGKPLPNTRVYVLNDDRGLVPVGVKGELWIAGRGLARGYLNLPERTAASFTDDPFYPGERMYCSGDLARWLPDGRLEYMGRKDEQVKIRGYRIELGEIESVLRSHERLSEAAVTAWDGASGDTVLCAYYVSAAPVTAEELKAFAAARLPAFMAPSHYTELSEMPLSSNGKIDRRALPQPEVTARETAEVQAQAVPSNPWEHRLAAVCREILERPEIGVTDDFFEAGGSSLHAMLLVSRVQHDYRAELPLHVILESSTIRGMAAFLMDNSKAEPQPIVRLNKKERRKTLFCFPPMGGLGIAYYEFAKQMDDCTIYALDYIDHPDRMERYVKLITAAQREGDYTFLGYSAGGNLAFEVIKAMEAAGYRVSDVIMLDAYRKTEPEPVTDEELQAMWERYIATPVIREFYKNFRINEQDLERLKQYSFYIYLLDNIGTVQADLHVVHSSQPEDEFRHPPKDEADQQYRNWQGATAGRVTYYQGVGGHERMLDPEHMEANVEIIKGIMGSAVVR
ncbi:non-ribosomal peptide synthetase [Paenibacillus oleatilyticus]|uniref:non-ribosomal peptide synthetase n=1 Tax=Paenibacillus oleatilyticus TaxID=2594886 RepID=UPI001C1F79E6|nr:non-ribosomal peptide synthetase [Paenibacillus oleatilyticus]MBU7318221.1 amino acid adenylation domain-containing protein [Paenibacillus oleatilyticus]